ncbi:hypothetical protein V498_04347 [Pseudogymnoascus sp. VKM F-4517 (FW-2822)]|nr:hypothetical protein V498_04347 [Pseudogymnoascus sp. VKM F-4517 (FW-2822)]
MHVIDREASLTSVTTMDLLYQTRETGKESLDNLLDNEVDYFDDANWVKVAWRRKDIPDVYQNIAGERRDVDGVESVEMHREENISGLAELALEILPEGERIDVALMSTERKVSHSDTQPHEAQIYRQGVSSNDSGSLIKRGHSNHPPLEDLTNAILPATCHHSNAPKIFVAILMISMRRGRVTDVQ